jgi:hypothetical protein
MDRANGSLLLESDLPDSSGTGVHPHNPGVSMKPEKPAPNPDDIELLPDAMERLERAVKAMARHGPVRRDAIKKPKKPARSRATRRP